MTGMILVNKHTGREYRVLSIDTATNKITLQGEIGSFTEDFDKEKLKKCGYTMVRERQNG